MLLLGGCMIILWDHVLSHIFGLCSRLWGYFFLQAHLYRRSCDSHKIIWHSCLCDDAIQILYWIGRTQFPCASGELAVSHHNLVPWVVAAMKMFKQLESLLQEVKWAEPVVSTGYAPSFYYNAIQLVHLIHKEIKFLRLCWTFLRSAFANSVWHLDAIITQTWMSHYLMTVTDLLCRCVHKTIKQLRGFRSLWAPDSHI